jgi:hypothetical protein
VILFVTVAETTKTPAPAAEKSGVGCWALFSSPKKVPPPTPDGREGRLFPPEQSWKTAVLVAELGCGGNKILRELTCRPGRFAIDAGDGAAFYCRKAAAG